jgi:hypothetical protein
MDRNTAELTKLRIDAFADPEYLKPVADPGARASGPLGYSLQINPETYKHQHSTSYQIESTTDTAGPTSKFVTMEPETVSFEFFLDGTGVIPGVTSVRDEIAIFKQVVYDYNGDIHSPNYLLLSWAGSVFKCRLTSLNIEYTLFAPSGSPLRARVDVSFQEYLSPDELAKRARKSSPDLTHVRTVLAGDTLPLMCFRIYGDSRWYPQVAAHNGLRDFRALVPGSRLTFPPLARA